MHLVWTYRAKVVRVVDADTIDMAVDLGFFMTGGIRFRVARIDAWEVRGEERERGLLAKAAVVEWLDEEWYTITTTKTGKYGRWIAEITKNGVNLSDWLVENGHAEYHQY